MKPHTRAKVLSVSVAAWCIGQYLFPHESVVVFALISVAAFIIALAAPEEQP